MKQLELEIERYDAKMDELRSAFMQREREYADEYDTVETSFGKELEVIRKCDLRAKREVLSSMEDGVENVHLPTDHEAAQRYEDLWHRKQQNITEEYAMREEELTREHRSRMEAMQAEIRMLEHRRVQQKKEDDKGKNAAPPFLGVELVEYPGVGARVTKSRGPSREAGVREGDILMNAQLSKNVNSKKVLKDIVSHAKPGQHLAFLVERDGGEHETVMEIPGRYTGL